jgi:hypothetical protein
VKKPKQSAENTKNHGKPAKKDNENPPKRVQTTPLTLPQQKIDGSRYQTKPIEHS